MTAARVMVPDSEMKCELDLYEYVPVQTKYVLFTTSLYLLHTIFPEYILVCMVFTKILQWMLVYVVCLWETILVCVCDMYAVVLQLEYSD